MAVTLRIEEVVLHGFDPRDRHAIGDALREELARLFGDSALPSPRSRGEGGRRPGEGRHSSTIHVDSVRSVDTIRAIAAAIHREVAR